MGTSLHLSGLLLYLLCALAASQSQERVWHSTSPTPPASAPEEPDLTTTTTTSVDAPLDLDLSTTSVDAALDPEPTTTDAPAVTFTTPAPEPVQDVLAEETTDAAEVVPEESVAAESSATETPELGSSETSEPVQDVLSVHLVEELENATSAEKVEKKKKKPRKWMSVPEEQIPIIEETDDLDLTASTEAPLDDANLYSINGTDFELPKNISDLLEAAEEEGVPMIQETIVSKKTTIYVTITESLSDSEPLYVNLTGIRDFTGKERRIVAGCLDLSDLQLTGEEAKEVIQRMSKQKFHRLDLSNNNINEFPTNTFSPVAFTVRELRLDGNPLLSNVHVEGSVLQRGGLFHLTELRELNLSSCGLRDIDFFTPWNSNRLEVVDLSANDLRAVPTNLQFFHKLKKLYLDGNRISEVGELPFALLWNMQVLSMSGCMINTIASDPLRNMEHLKEISLAGNNLTRIAEVRLPRSSSGVKMYLSGNPWHCACEMLNFVDYHHYAIRDLEDIRCATPRWLEGLRTAYLTKEILSLDSIDGDCSPPMLQEVAVPVARHYPTVRTDRLEVISLVVFVLAAVFMLLHILWSKRNNKYKFDDDRNDINYIRIDRKPLFK